MRGDRPRVGSPATSGDADDDVVLRHLAGRHRAGADGGPRTDRPTREHHRAAIEGLGLPAPEADDAQRRTCAAYWKTPTISWDGKVVLCTVDTQQTLKIGDAHHDSLTDQWWRSPRMQQVRKQVLREDFSDHVERVGA